MTNKKLTLLISVTYVVLATIYAFYGLNNAVNEGFLYSFFLPANFFAQLIIFTERSPFLWLVMSQLITLGLTYLLVYSLIFFIRRGKDLK